MYAGNGSVGTRQADSSATAGFLTLASVAAGGGSDSFVTPIRPLWGIPRGQVNHLEPEQRITPLEALKMFTSTSAYIGFEEHETGTLKIGKRGDVVVLSGRSSASRRRTTIVRTLAVEMTDFQRASHLPG